MRLFSRFDPLKLILIALVTLIGLPFLGVGLYEVYQNRKKINAFVHTLGTVVGNSYATTNHDGTLSGAYYPVVEFTDTKGTLTRFTDGIGSLPPDYVIGRQVAVIYNPLNPKEARIYTWKRIWFAPTLLITIGLLPTIAAIVMMVIIKRSLTRPRSSA